MKDRVTLRITLLYWFNSIVSVLCKNLAFSQINMMSNLHIENNKKKPNKQKQRFGVWRWDLVVAEGGLGGPI